jgi:hypothetical protein
LQARVDTGRTRRDRSKRGLRRSVTEDSHGGKRQASFGEGAGLVQADHVDPSKSLDRGELLHKDACPPESNDADGKGHAGEQNKALRDHAPDTGNRATKGVGKMFVLRQLARYEQHGHGRDGPGDESEDAVDACAELGAHQ